MREFELQHSRERSAALSQLEKGSKIHVIGICGTGTGSLAALLKDKGFVVSGSDKAFYPPMGDFIKKTIDQIYCGYSADNLADDIDGFIIGNAIRSDNPEAVAALETGKPYASMPEALSAFLIGERSYCPNSIVVSGTHGKTTTTSLITAMLDYAGRKPGYFIGGMPGDFAKPVRLVAEDVEVAKRSVVLEGDEYDSAWFAKWPKFLSYRPDILLITSIEFDHADIYQTVEQIEDEFVQAISLVPESGFVVACADNERVRAVVERAQTRGLLKAEVVFYGSRDLADYCISRRTVDPASGLQNVAFTVRTTIGSGDTRETDSFATILLGEHSALNALAAFAVGRLLGLDRGVIAAGIKSFSGVARRQQIRFQNSSTLLIEDFAHHPTAVKTTLAGLRERYRDWRIVAFFEPRSNTSRRAVFQRAYAESFFAADEAWIRRISSEGVYSKFGDASELDVERLVRDIEATGCRSGLLESMDEFLAKAGEVLASAQSSQQKTLFVMMSNGDFSGLPDKLTAMLNGAA
ncbi:MAG: Mur ligase family protein [bacterium]|nr:Mur ligase family protein [bacterium]